MTGSQACSGHRLRVGRSPGARRPPGPPAGTTPARQAAPRPRWTRPTRHRRPGARPDRRGRPCRHSPGDPGTAAPRPDTAVGVGEPDRTAGSNRLRVADRAQEPVPGLAAASRAAHRITPRPGRNGIVAPRAHPRHGRTPVPRTAADSNGDSNSGSQPQASAVTVSVNLFVNRTRRDRARQRRLGGSGTR